MRLVVGVSKNFVTSAYYTLVYSVWEYVSNNIWASMNEFTQRDDPLVTITVNHSDVLIFFILI